MTDRTLISTLSSGPPAGDDTLSRQRSSSGRAILVESPSTGPGYAAVRQTTQAHTPLAARGCTLTSWPCAKGRHHRIRPGLPPRPVEGGASALAGQLAAVVLGGRHGVFLDAASQAAQA